ncbi:MAG: histidine kinase, partial [Planctomycetota bacterium]
MKVSGKLCAADGLSKRVDTMDAVREACDQVTGQIGSNPDVALAFFTMHHAAQAARILEGMRGHLGADLVVGVTASGVIGAGQDVQMGPGFSIWSARRPGTRARA